MVVKIFFYYAERDTNLLYKLKSHLIPLQREGLIDMWCDHDISARAERDQEIIKHLDEAQIILLLISPYSIASNYNYDMRVATNSCVEVLY